MPRDGPPRRSQSEATSEKRAHEDVEFDAPEDGSTSPIRKRLRVEENPEKEPAMTDEAVLSEHRESASSASGQPENTPSLSSLSSPWSDEDDESIDINLSTPLNESSSLDDVNATDPAPQEPQSHPVNVAQESLAGIEATLDELVQISDREVDQLFLRFSFDETSEGVDVQESLWALLPDDDDDDDDDPSRQDEVVLELRRELARNLRRLYQRRAVRGVSGREYMRLVMAEKTELSDASNDGFDQDTANDDLDQWDI
ncbi:hypothetical protein ACJ41O_009582 [Fusarium nematophilum]